MDRVPTGRQHITAFLLNAIKATMPSAELWGLKADRIGGQRTNRKTTYDPMIGISTPEHMAYPETVNHFHSQNADQCEYLAECVRPAVLAARTLKYPEQENTQSGHTEIPNTGKAETTILFNI